MAWIATVIEKRKCQSDSNLEVIEVSVGTNGNREVICPLDAFHLGDLVVYAEWGVFDHSCPTPLLRGVHIEGDHYVGGDLNQGTLLRWEHATLHPEGTYVSEAVGFKEDELPKKVREMMSPKTKAMIMLVPKGSTYYLNHSDFDPVKEANRWTSINGWRSPEGYWKIVEAIGADGEPVARFRVGCGIEAFNMDLVEVIRPMGLPTLRECNYDGLCDIIHQHMELWHTGKKIGGYEVQIKVGESFFAIPLHDEVAPRVVVESSGGGDGG